MAELLQSLNGMTQIFVNTSMGDESNFPFIFLFNAHQIVDAADVEYRKDNGVRERVESSGDKWKRVILP